MASITFSSSIFSFIFYIVCILFSTTFAEEEVVNECIKEEGTCYNKSKALDLKIIAIFSILVTSVIGVVLPLFSRYIPSLRPDRKFFVLIKAFASGVILATGYMHLLPESFDNLNSPCLPENPWSNFPFTAFIVMISAVFTLMVDSYMLTFFNRKKGRCNHVSPNDESSPISHHHIHAHAIPYVPKVSNDEEKEVSQLSKDEGKEIPQPSDDEFDKGISLRRNRIIAQVLEMGIVVHSVVIGLSVGASENPCTIRPLIAALCFHQMFEGMGLGGCILVAEYNLRIKAIMVLFFSVTTPFGIALGIALSKVYEENSPTALIVIGVLNAASTGLLNYMALVDLLAADFMGPRLQADAKLQSWAYVAVLLGAGGMSVISLWA